MCIGVEVRRSFAPQSSMLLSSHRLGESVATIVTSTQPSRSGFIHSSNESRCGTLLLSAKHPAAVFAIPVTVQ